MAKVFYDRSGKAHVLGEKPGAKSNEEESSKPGKKLSDAVGGSKKTDRPAAPFHSEPKQSKRFSAKGGGAGGKRNERPPFKNKDSFQAAKKFGDASSAGKGFEKKNRPLGRPVPNPDVRSFKTDEAPRTPWGNQKPAAKKFGATQGGERSGGFNRDRGPGYGGGGAGGSRGRGGFSKDGPARESGSTFRGKRDERGGRDGNRFEARDRNGKTRDGGGGSNFKSGNVRKGARGTSRARPPREPHPDWIQLKGIIDKNKKGSAFLVFDRRDLEDVFIPRYYVEQLFHGDRVQVYISPEGEIEDLKVLEHRFKHIFGRVILNEGGREGLSGKSKQKERTGFLIYERKKAKEEVYIPVVPIDVKNGDWVKAEIQFSEEGGSISAQVMEVIGPELPPSYDIQMVAGEFNLTEHHTFEAVKQAESYKLEVPGKDEEGRTDLRHIPFMTIDGERARDFDDAVYVENLGKKGFRLWVAIADVSHYVKVGTPLDDEAYKRGTSVYFPERAFHMLPRALSEELCSLKPNVPRLGMAMSADFNADGEKTGIKLYDAIIESRRRATYNEIESEKADPKHKDLFDLYRILKKKRFERGSIDFDFPEAEIILDEKTGDPKDIVVRDRQDAHRLIEEFMIVANESVTEWMLERKLPFIYRVHDEPSAEAMEKFRKLSKNMGFPLLSKGGVPRPKVLAEFIRTLKDHPAEPILATGLLRSMRQAIYSATHGEHFGLASEGYTHFTSPIRRYPDLVVHRQLRAALHREQAGQSPLSGAEAEEVQEKLNETAEHCSYRERVATEAERESIRFKSVRLMAKHLGEEFEGKVNGLHERGMYIQLHHPYCEGMVPIDSIKDDWYEFHEERMLVSGRKTKRTFTIGQPVTIQVVRVDLDARQVEFQLVTGGKKPKAGKKSFEDTPIQSEDFDIADIMPEDQLSDE